MTTQVQVRDSFWHAFPKFAAERRTRKRQNDYRCAIRCIFVAYVDGLQRNGEISDALACRVTL